ncbi:MAG TPA: pantoate--beta-alanine ligase, partial [Actinomycetaceae bacterium]|nr:pantoate--beta-alanine ligase [Actinomycetaceae bacterium]
RVGAVLAAALRRAGHDVIGATAVSQDSHDRIDALLPGVPVIDIPDVIAAADLVLLTVPDDVLPDVVAGAAQLGHWRAGQIVLHTAGRYGTEVLAPAEAAGALGLAVHPAMTFTGTSLDLSRLIDCPFAVTAAPAILPIAQALVVEIGGEPIALPGEGRLIYHTALSHGANHLVTLVTQARRLLEAAGMSESATTLRALLTAALEGALESGEASLTGPVARGDAGTVAAHLEALTALADTDPGLTDVLTSYRALATATAERARDTRRLAASRAAHVLAALTTPAVPTGVQPDDRQPRLVTTREELARVLAAPRGRRAVVMTMGALHAGHLSLVEEARRVAEQVVVTIFVNPLQFGAGEDLETYPRDLEGDVAKLAGAGADVVFAPDAAEIYPDGEPLVRIDPGPAGEVLEGASRPGHFGGVLTVVAKLLHLTRPDVAIFGQKDAQQLALITAMARDLDLGVEIRGVATRRDADGLALSSRNAYLATEERDAALAIPRALAAATAAAGEGAATALDAARREVAAEGRLRLDYLEIVDPVTLKGVGADHHGPALLVVAAWSGTTRLIDNELLHLAGPDDAHPGVDPTTKEHA